MITYTKGGYQVKVLEITENLIIGRLTDRAYFTLARWRRRDGKPIFVEGVSLVASIVQNDYTLDLPNNISIAKYCGMCRRETYHFDYNSKCIDCALNYPKTESLEKEFEEFTENNSFRHQIKYLYMKTRILEIVKEQDND